MEHLSHLYPPSLPKGRGRPRATYAQTGEFDLGLIREYRSRPVLYDRTNKRFKDKLYVAQQWEQISHKLGYDATSLRDRMITLRNRYNIEKRRVENGLSTQASQWPLFESLQFLGDHIRPRRSFKNIKLDDDEEPYEVDESDSNGHMMSVKDEIEDDSEIFDCEQTLPVTTVLGIPLNNSDEIKSQRQLNGSDVANGKSYNHFAESYQRRQNVQPEYITSSPIVHKSISGKRGAQHEEHTAAKRSRAAAAEESQHLSTFPSFYPAPLPPAYAKFHGFGEFMVHSLCDMSPDIALRLVQKFTRELVHTSLRNEDSGSASSKRKPDQSDPVDPVDQSSESQEEEEDE